MLHIIRPPSSVILWRYIMCVGHILGSSVTAEIPPHRVNLYKYNFDHQTYIKMLMLPNGRYVAFVKIPLSCFSLEYSCLQWYAVKKKQNPGE